MPIIRRRFEIAVGLFMVVSTTVAVIYSIVVQTMWNQRVHCLENFANSSVVRAQALNTAFLARSNAQAAVTHTLNKALIDAINKKQAAIAADVKAYEAAVSSYNIASNNYDKAAGAYPPPVSY